MGVQGLWELLAPVGRRVSVETLAGKRLAIDASIWMVQFMKAMRDEKGEMVRNAHLIGFFRRICKLLFLRTKPVFVFDGGTPALKRRTIVARRRQRENTKAKIRKTAEKLLLNQLKAARLKELAEDIRNQRPKNDTKGKKVLSEQIQLEAGDLVKNDDILISYNQDKLDEMLAASIAAEEGGNLTNDPSTSAAEIPIEETDNEDEEMILTGTDGKVDPAILAALSPSMQRDLLDQMKTVKSGESPEDVQKQNLDEMLAASFAANEGESLRNMASASFASGLPEEGSDEDEEMILPAVHGKIDPTVLAALPPSIQLDLLVQIRERLMAENRQKYQRVKKDPSKFSELQIQSYLKTVAFRREIDEVQRSAAGIGVGGVQTSRIASEANREFIFSSSFTGDKHLLASAGRERTGETQQKVLPENPSSDSMIDFASIINSNTGKESVPDEPIRDFDDDVGTYCDERGRVRLSRNRAMGILMTRDLQRNLDLMKEIEQERTNALSSGLPTTRNFTAVDSSIKNKSVEVADHSDGDYSNVNGRKESSMLKNEAAIEISFEDNKDNKDFDGGDDIFARLVAGDLITISSANSPQKENSRDSDSDCDWEDGTIQGEINTLSDNKKAESKPSHAEGNNSDESDVEWVEEAPDIPQPTSSYAAEVRKLSKGYLEEEADLQEALRRSLADIRDNKPDHLLSESTELINSGDKARKDSGSCDKQIGQTESNMQGGSCSQQHELPLENLEEELSSECVMKVSTIDSPAKELRPSAEGISYIKIPIDEPHGKDPNSPKLSKEDLGGRANPCSQKLCTESGSSAEREEANAIAEQCLDTSNGGGAGMSAFATSLAGEESHTICAAFDEPDGVFVDAKQNDSKAEPETLPTDMDNMSIPKTESSLKESTSRVDVRGQINETINFENHNVEREEDTNSFVIKDNADGKFSLTEANLEEEMLVLDQESIDLGVEQRKLERNAESVSTEMFAECQELLQMFGLPYIIAPMEAEAQCAYMELANLVDGVVTDDSDVFLFGARSVYKNIFDDRKYVETYFMKDIESELGLSREKLIRMALLLGSDYTEGVSGIGIVNAMEVVNAFPEEDGLLKFRDWVESPDPTILGKLDSKSGSATRKKEAKFSERNANDSDSHAEGMSRIDAVTSQDDESEIAADHISEVKQIFMEKHRNVSKNWHIPSSFPSEAVISAYISPQVDRSTDPFSWGKPDISLLRKLCWDKFGWGSQKADEILLPVLKEYNKHETQLRLEAFYTFNERFAKIRSKRIKKAVKEITGKQSLELMDDSKQDVSASRKKKKVGHGDPGNKISENRKEGMEEAVAQNQRSYTEKSKSTFKRKSRMSRDHNSFDTKDPEQSVPVESKKRTKKGNTKEKARGRVRGAGSGWGKRNIGSRLSETSSTDEDGVNDDEETCVKKLQEPQELRKSARSRKPVNYCESDLEINGGKDLSHKIANQHEDEKTAEPVSSLDQDLGKDAADLHQEKQHETEEFSPEKELSGNYLEAGGGFCIDEDEKDYLETGGGFCMVEDEGDKEPDKCNDLITANDSEADKPLQDSTFINEVDFEAVQEKYIRQSDRDELPGRMAKNSSDAFPSNAASNNSKAGASEVESVSESGKTSSVGVLSAMPSLRRKRKKS